MSRSKIGVGGIVAVLALLSGTIFGGMADAKGKKKGGNKPVSVRPFFGNTGFVPNFGPPGSVQAPVPFFGNARIANKFKGRTIADVDMTISASALLASGSDNAMADLVVKLTGPNGATTTVMAGGYGAGFVSGTLVSNLTLSDETPTLTCGGSSLAPPPPPCNDPYATVGPPFTGTAEPSGSLSTLYGGPMKGTYTLTAFDTCYASSSLCTDSGASFITSWSLKVTPEKP